MVWGPSHSESWIQYMRSLQEEPHLVSGVVFFLVTSHVFPEFLSQWQYCTSYRMIYFLYEVNCCFLAFYFMNTSYYDFSLHIVDKSSFESNFGLIEQPNELVPDYSYSLLFLSILMSAYLRQMNEIVTCNRRRTF